MGLKLEPIKEPELRVRTWKAVDFAGNRTISKYEVVTTRGDRPVAGPFDDKTVAEVAAITLMGAGSWKK